jgi:histidinol-phosphate/aromatic aminotransferase/cobyric acid decarboxylase-like protein
MTDTGVLAAGVRHGAGVAVGLASPADRARIYRMRHGVYARQLGQHAERADGLLRDELDDRNVYIVATVGGELAGFISVTPPGPRYSIDKYFAVDTLPFTRDEGLFEIRLLTVAAERRGWRLAALLMYAALRWVEEHGGTHVVALGRDRVLDLYLGAGLRPVGRTVHSGAVLYHLLAAPVDALRAGAARRSALLARLGRDVAWRLPMPFSMPAGDEPACYHGGAFFEAIGEEFDTLERFDTVISADVLDAWFPPSPRVLQALREHLPWLVRSSPPTTCAGLVRTIARVQGVDPASILPGGGSSDLIFLALTRWLSRDSRVLILDPMYGEYSHVLEQVIRCAVDRLPLARAGGYALRPADLVERARAARYDLVFLVNPNSPTGQHTRRSGLEPAIAELSRTTPVWIDETYIEYAGPRESLEPFASTHERVVVCKSMSKVYGLSGLRVGYLCASPATIGGLRPYSPPWAVGLPAQVAAVHALQDQQYYRSRWTETHALRQALAARLRRLGIDVLDGVANFLLCDLPAGGPDAAVVTRRARERGLFVREVSSMGRSLGPHALRVAVKDTGTNERMLRILGDAIGLEGDAHTGRRSSRDRTSLVSRR